MKEADSQWLVVSSRSELAPFVPSGSMEELEQRFNALLKDLAASLTTTDVDEIQGLVDANELGVALENLCVQLIERGAVCSRLQVDRIASIGAAMGD